MTHPETIASHKMSDHRTVVRWLMWPSDKKVWKPSKVWAVLVLIAEILQKQQALPLILN